MVSGPPPTRKMPTTEGYQSTDSGPAFLTAKMRRVGGWVFCGTDSGIGGRGGLHLHGSPDDVDAVIVAGGPGEAWTGPSSENWLLGALIASRTFPWWLCYLLVAPLVVAERGSIAVRCLVSSALALE